MSVMAGEGPVLYLGKTRRPSGRSRHRHHHLHTFRDNQLPRYHPKYLKARPRGASRLRRLLSPYLTWAVITSQAVAIIAAMTPLFFPPDDDDDDDDRRSFGFYMMPARDGKI